MEVTVVQKDFSAIRQTIGLTVVGEEPAVISTVPVEPPQPSAAPADARTPTISFLRYPTGAKVSSEAIVLRFEVHHEADLVDLRLTHNGKQLTVGEPAEVTEQATGARTIRLAQYELPVQLDEGENRFEVIAVTGEGTRGLRVLSIIRDRHAGEVWLAVVGVSDYLDPNVRDLAFADADARAVHDYYQSRFKLPPDHLFLLVNEEATLRNVKSVLGTQLARHASHPDDTVGVHPLPPPGTGRRGRRQPRRSHRRRRDLPLRLPPGLRSDLGPAESRAQGPAAGG